MKFDIITIFPSIFSAQDDSDAIGDSYGYFGVAMIKRALDKKIIEINVHDLRNWTDDKHRTVDDTPYGGGAGMVMKVEPIHKAVGEIKSKIQDNNSKTRTILFSAKGKTYTQADAKRLAEYDNLIFICGRYEGVDERVAKVVVDEEISIGGYVLTGGEIPAMAIVDSITRLLPGVLGNAESPICESHSEEGYLEHPQYTKPEIFLGEKVPEVLLSGNHNKIEKWREENAINSKSQAANNK